MGFSFAPCCYCFIFVAIYCHSNKTCHLFSYGNQYSHTYVWPILNIQIGCAIKLILLPNPCDSGISISYPCIHHTTFVWWCAPKKESHWHSHIFKYCTIVEYHGGWRSVYIEIDSSPVFVVRFELHHHITFLRGVIFLTHVFGRFHSSSMKHSSLIHIFTPIPISWNDFSYGAI